MNWLKFGDKNTKFFHQSTMQRRRCNKVLKLKVNDQRWIEDEAEIMGEFQGFCKGLYATGGVRNMD